LGAGDFFGPALSGAPAADDTATAKGAVSIWRAPIDEFRRLLLHHPAVAWGFVSLLALRQRQMERRLESFAFKRTEARLAETFRELPDRGNRQTDRFVNILRQCYLQNSEALFDLSGCRHTPISGAPARRFRANWQETKMNKAYLEITMKVPAKDRMKAGAVYSKYKGPFLATIPGAESKELLLREEDVQVLHGFDSRASAESYLTSALFGNDVVRELKPYLSADPEVRLYERQ
jgi:hypothetical protein